MRMTTIAIEVDDAHSLLLHWCFVVSVSMLSLNVACSILMVGCMVVY